MHALIVFDVFARECEADEDLTKLVVDIKGADDGAAALLIECRGEDADALKVILHLVWLQQHAYAQYWAILQ